MYENVVMQENNSQELQMYQERAKYIEEVELPETNKCIKTLEDDLLAAHQKRQELFAELRRIQTSTSSLEITALRRSHEARMKALSSQYLKEESKISERESTELKCDMNVNVKGRETHIDPTTRKADSTDNAEIGEEKEHQKTEVANTGAATENANSSSSSCAVKEGAGLSGNKKEEDTEGEEPRTPLKNTSPTAAAARTTPRTPTALLVKRSASLPTPQDAPRPSPAVGGVPFPGSRLPTASQDVEDEEEVEEEKEEADLEGLSGPRRGPALADLGTEELDPIRPLLYEALSKAHQPDLLADEEEDDETAAQEAYLVAHLEDRAFGWKPTRDSTTRPTYPRRQQRVSGVSAVSRGRGRPTAAAGYSDEAEDEALLLEDHDGDDEDPFPLCRREFKPTGSASGFRSAFQRRRGVLDAREMDEEVMTEEAEEDFPPSISGAAAAGMEAAGADAFVSLPAMKGKGISREDGVSMRLPSTSSPSPPDDSSEPLDDDAEDERRRGIGIGAGYRHPRHMRNRRKEGNYRLEHTPNGNALPSMENNTTSTGINDMKSFRSVPTLDGVMPPSPSYHIVVPEEESSADSAAELRKLASKGPSAGGVSGGVTAVPLPNQENLFRGGHNKTPDSDDVKESKMEEDMDEENGGGAGGSSEGYEVRYQRLYKVFNRFLGKGESGYLMMWQRIGGSTGWQENIRPWELSLILSREKTDIAEFRVGAPSEQRVGIRDNTTEIDQEEVVGFFTHFLSRLPRLEYASLFFSSACPFDWDALELVEEPFPSLKVLNLRWTRVKGTDLLKAVGMFKRLNVGALRATNSLVDYGHFNNFGTLAKECKRRLMMY